MSDKDKDPIPKTPFKKRTYRPWDINLFGDEESQGVSQTINKHLTNHNEMFVNQLPNDSETLNNNLPNVSQTINKQFNKLVSQTIDKQLTNSLTNTNQEFSVILKEIKRLSGIQKTLMYLIANNCVDRQSLTTDPFTKSELENSTGTNGDVINTTIQRLAKKGFISRSDYKTGKGGYRNFSITQHVRDAVTEAQRQHGISSQLTNSLTNTINKHSTNNWQTNNETSSPINNNNSNTIIISELPEDWKSIDLSTVEEIGFKPGMLLQLYKLNVTTPEIIQESIKHFAYGLEYNPRFKEYTNHATILFDCLRKGKCWTEPNYESPQKKAMRELLERKRVEQEEFKKMEQELEEIQFNEWLSTMTEQEKRGLVSSMNRNRPLDNPLVIGELKTIYKQRG